MEHRQAAAAAQCDPSSRLGGFANWPQTTPTAPGRSTGNTRSLRSPRSSRRLNAARPTTVAAVVYLLTAGLEPAISALGGQRRIHWATRAPKKTPFHTCRRHPPPPQRYGIAVDGPGLAMRVHRAHYSIFAAPFLFLCAPNTACCVCSACTAAVRCDAMQCDAIKSMCV